MREPYISQAKAKLGSNHILFKAPGLYQQIDVVVVQPRLLEERPEVVRRLLQALSEAETYIHSHPKEAIKLISQRLGVAPSTLEQNWPEMSMRLSLNQSMLVMMEDIARWAIKSGMVEPQLVPDFLDLIVPGPLQAIAPRAVTLIQ
jgi:NitT/TauT family transport system substrate-binding protein